MSVGFALTAFITTSCVLLNVATSSGSIFTEFAAKKVNVKFSHTRYRALGPELIPVYRQSARR